MAIAATAVATASPISRPPRNVRMIYLSPNERGKGRATKAASGLQFRLLPDNHLGANRDALVEVGDIGIDQPEAARGNRGADRVGPVGAVDAVDGGAEIHRPRAERIAGTAGHEAWQIGLARDHLRWRMPVGPFRLAADRLYPGPGKAVAADADAVPDGAALSEHVV